MSVNCGDYMFYKGLMPVILTKVKNHLKRDTLALQRQTLDPNLLKPPLFDEYIKHFFTYMLAVNGSHFQIAASLDGLSPPFDFRVVCRFVYLWG